MILTIYNFYNICSTSEPPIHDLFIPAGLYKLINESTRSCNDLYTLPVAEKVSNRLLQCSHDWQPGLQIMQYGLSNFFRPVELGSTHKVFSFECDESTSEEFNKMLYMLPKNVLMTSLTMVCNFCIFIYPNNIFVFIVSIFVLKAGI